MSFTITVTRKKSKGIGTLTYKSSNITVSTPCWYEIANPISAKTYTNCSATYMSRKLNSRGGPREAIFIPNEQTGRKGIFIHLGINSFWSQGCIVAAEAQVLKIWQDINPKDGANVTVQVKDA